MKYIFSSKKNNIQYYITSNEKQKAEKLYNKLEKMVVMKKSMVL
jgi:phage terminase large subunit-like protein